MQPDPVKTIAESRYFSADWYRRTYPDVALSGMDPIQHYLHLGAPMGRDPGPDFSAAFYMAHHADVREAGHNPLWHYELFGRDEAREIAPSRVHRNGIDEDIATAEIDRRRPALPEGAVLADLREILARRLDGPPHRLLTTFDQALSRRTVDNLVSLHKAELDTLSVKASIVMPAWNRAEKIQRAIASAQAQSHRNFELIVADDGSTDETAQVVSALAAKDPRIRLLRSAHGGVSAARNAALAAATGEVIFYLDTDNSWTRDFLRLMLIALQVAGTDCAYAALRVQGPDGRIAGYRGEPFDWAACLKGNYVDLNVFCHRRAVFDDLGGFDPLLRRMVDWDLILRYTRDAGATFVPFIGCLYDDDKRVRGRISTSQPYIFHRIVAEKNAHSHTTASETLRGLTLDIAFKVAPGQAEQPEIRDLASALEQSGHRVRIDPLGCWYARHPHQDDLALILCDPDIYQPHPEQLSLVWLPDNTTPAAEQAVAITRRIRNDLTAPLTERSE